MASKCEELFLRTYRLDWGAEKGLNNRWVINPGELSLSWFSIFFQQFVKKKVIVSSSDKFC